MDPNEDRDINATVGSSQSDFMVSIPTPIQPTQEFFTPPSSPRASSAPVTPAQTRKLRNRRVELNNINNVIQRATRSKIRTIRSSTPPTVSTTTRRSRPRVTVNLNDEQSVTSSNQESQSSELNLSDIDQMEVDQDTSRVQNEEDAYEQVFERIVEEETGWVSNGTVHAYKYKFQVGLTDKNKIAAFDLDGTLITPKSKNRFSRDVNDWKLLDGRLKNKIEKLINDGYSFVIISNQMGVSTRFISLQQIRKKFENIVQYINLPCVAMLATNQDKNRKPSTGMLEFYNTNINTQQLELKDSFYVGDAMGRPKDHSAADLLFAFNARLPFISIESFLSGLEKPRQFSLQDLTKYRVPKFPNAQISRLDSRVFLKNNQNTETEYLCVSELIQSIDDYVNQKHKSIVIICIGLHGSGKSHFVSNYLNNSSYQIIDYDPYRKFDEDKIKFLSIVNDDNIIDKRIVIDHPNLDIKTRKKWIELSKNENYEVLAIYFNMKVEQCQHNVRFRSYYTEPNRKTPTNNQLLKQDLALNLPEYFEGFKSIYYIGYRPEFNNDFLKSVYCKFLYDKP